MSAGEWVQAACAVLVLVSALLCLVFGIAMSQERKQGGGGYSAGSLVSGMIFMYGMAFIFAVIAGLLIRGAIA